jgi:hypothetical protein
LGAEYQWSEAIPIEAAVETLIEFQNQSNGGVSALVMRVSPVVVLTTSW